VSGRGSGAVCKEYVRARRALVARPARARAVGVRRSRGASIVIEQDADLVAGKLTVRRATFRQAQGAAECPWHVTRLAIVVLVVGLPNLAVTLCGGEAEAREQKLRCLAGTPMLEMEPNLAPGALCFRIVDRHGIVAALRARPELLLHRIQAGVPTGGESRTELRHDEAGLISFCPFERLTPGATYRAQIVGSTCRSVDLGDFTVPEEPPPLPSRPEPAIGTSMAAAGWPWRATLAVGIGAGLLCAMIALRRRALIVAVP